MLASTQRDYIAGEVSRDLTKRILLPEKISKAHEEGILHFHDTGYFLQPIFNCCLINLEDMLDNGTVINGKLIETPKSFKVACIVTSQIIAAVASNQYGEQSVDIKCLGKYLRKSYIKLKNKLEEKYNGKLSDDIIEDIANQSLQAELISGVQTMQYQLNTLMTTNGKVPNVTLFLNLDEENKYLKENAMIIEEILNQRLVGIKNEKGVYVTPAFPKLVYVLDENNDLYLKTNKELVSTEELSNKYDVQELKKTLEEHVKYTNSVRGKEILENFEEYLPKFKKIIPYDYKKILNAIAKMEEKGLNPEQAQIEAFYAATR